MKVVLSRKGFDTQYGGVPNAVLPDGSLVAFPIEDSKSIILAEDIRRGAVSIGVMAEQLTCERLHRSYRAHLDPDLDAASYPRVQGWRPVLGQTGSALGHLDKQGIGRGDLFLFFAWFRPVERRGSTWAYVPGSSPVHVLWGWLYVGAAYDHTAIPETDARWLAYHPHIQRSARRRHRFYVASDVLEVGGRRMAGGGVFPCLRGERVLTALGENMSVWTLPGWMHPEAGLASLTFHGDASRWRHEEGATTSVQTVGRGQEFVLTVRNPEPLDRWLCRLFADVPSTG